MNYSRFYPVRATDLGLHDFDDRLAHYTHDLVSQEIDSLEMFQNKLTAIDFEALTTDERIDYLLLRSNLWEYVFDLIEEYKVYMNESNFDSLIAFCSIDPSKINLTNLKIFVVSVDNS